MSVHKRTYHAYTGPLTPSWSRFAVLTRFGFEEVWGSRITNVLFVVCLVPVLFWLVTLYLINSPTAQMLVGANMKLLAADEKFFARILEVQCWLALVLNAWVAPRLISLDLSNNALPILLSRPISRVEYVVGKLTVLWALLSLVTWVPALLLFLMQGYMTNEAGWMLSKLSIAYGSMAGAVIWIGLLSLLSLALSSWVKWRIVATGLIFGAVFVPAGVGEVFNEVMRTRWGVLLNLPFLMTDLWERLLRVPVIVEPKLRVPTLAILAMLMAICLVSVAALNARIRAREVVRG